MILKMRALMASSLRSRTDHKKRRTLAREHVSIPLFPLHLLLLRQLKVTKIELSTLTMAIRTWTNCHPFEGKVRTSLRPCREVAIRYRLSRAKSWGNRVGLKIPLFFTELFEWFESQSSQQFPLFIFCLTHRVTGHCQPGFSFLWHQGDVGGRFELTFVFDLNKISSFFLLHANTMHHANVSQVPKEVYRRTRGLESHPVPRELVFVVRGCFWLTGQESMRRRGQGSFKVKRARGEKTER